MTDGWGSFDDMTIIVTTSPFGRDKFLRRLSESQACNEIEIRRYFSCKLEITGFIGRPLQGVSGQNTVNSLTKATPMTSDLPRFQLVADRSRPESSIPRIRRTSSPSAQ
jgi:hypothetical protein